MPDKKLPAVPETVLKKRKRQAENRALRAKESIKNKIARKAKRVEAFKRAEQYCKEYQNKERDEIRYGFVRVRNFSGICCFASDGELRTFRM
jgi:peptide methionine sulfoxide reductase MsrA